MARPIAWWRWYRGKVWHVAMAGDPAALCGQTAEAFAERTETYAPTNARVCTDCAAAASSLAELVAGAVAGDPRFLQASEPLVEAPRPAAESVDLVAALKQSIEAAQARRAAAAEG